MAKRAANTLPPSSRASVYCCLPRWLIAHKQTTPAILLNTPLPPTPPPYCHCNSIIPPLLVRLAVPAESRGAAIANPSGSHDGNAEEYAKGAVVAMFAGTRWGGPCFIGHDIFVSGSGGATGWDDDNDDFVSRLFPWWLVR